MSLKEWKIKWRIQEIAYTYKRLSPDWLIQQRTEETIEETLSGFFFNLDQDLNNKFMLPINNSKPLNSCFKMKFLKLKLIIIPIKDNKYIYSQWQK